MAYLPKEALTLTGGCCCKAIRYTVHIPAWDQRPAVPGALKTPISVSEDIETRMPLIDLDHCNSCREVSGAIIQTWLIVPVDWVEWDLARLDKAGIAEMSPRTVLSTVDAVGPIETDTTSPQTYVTRFNRSERATRAFCSRCGTNLTYLSHKRLNTPMAFVDITVGTLDREHLEMVKPDRHGWWDSGVGWIKELLRHGDGGFMIRHATNDVSKELEDNVKG
ncbi:hypothetical protein B0A52_05338 [Exophiala mesophila]|uniref:CENP-V/GFA domain-containing protein n=1 Tax=Exophiala mesophila TaxID=212818 RepID=A0A438N4K2_EXOME|nr:hypothetical protein B0A52_05338 [Exophiala mesophila]